MLLISIRDSSSAGTTSIKKQKFSVFYLFAYKMNLNEKNFVFFEREKNHIVGAIERCISQELL